MSVDHLPLPARWIEAIHARLTLAYGERMWLTYGQLAREEVVQAWARELRYCSKEQIAYALDHLPGDFPPNAMQFKTLCKGMPRQGTLPALGGPNGVKPSPRVQEELKRLIGRFKAQTDPKRWAHALRDRDAAGEKLTLYQINAWRSVCRPAVGANIPEPSNGAGSGPSEPDVL